MKPSKSICNVATLMERYFTERLMRQRNVSANTIASYRDTFRLLFTFAQARLRKSPSDLALDDLAAPFISAFLIDLETTRGASAKTRNLRLTAIRSFFRFVSFEEPAHSAMIQRVLAIPSKRDDKREVHFLARPEIEAILGRPRSVTAQVMPHFWRDAHTQHCVADVHRIGWEARLGIRAHAGTFRRRR